MILLIAVFVVIISTGGEFLLKYVKVKDELRCYFIVTEDGKPVKLQRKPYSECFYTIGLIELYRATSNIKYEVELYYCGLLQLCIIKILCSILSTCYNL